MPTPARQARAVFDAETITVYQAYPPEIAGPAVGAGTFVPPLGMHRMTWIKPSFLWMMYRAGWATKPGKERVLAIRIRREGFLQALSGACLSAFDPAHHESMEAWREQLHSTTVRVQWDPERTMTGAALPHRSLQVGISGATVAQYVQEWIVDLTDITASLPAIRAGEQPLPDERPFALPPEIGSRLGATG